MSTYDPAPDRERLFQALESAQCVGDVACKALFRRVFATSSQSEVPLWIDYCLWLAQQDGARTLSSGVINAACAEASVTSETPACYSPDEVARVLLHPDWPATRHGALQDAVLRCALANPTASMRLEAKHEFTQLMVVGSTPETLSGLAARLELWRVVSDRNQKPGTQAQGPWLFRAPGAALLQIDLKFEVSLQRAQIALRRMVKPGAPSVAWCLRPLASAQNEYEDTVSVTGPSASVALFFGALWVLREHISDEYEQVKHMLFDIDSLEQFSICAQMGDVEQHLLKSRLATVGDIDYKLDALAFKVPGRTMPRTVLVAPGTSTNARQLNAQPVDTLEELFQQVHEHHGSHLDEICRAFLSAVLLDAQTSRAVELALATHAMAWVPQSIRGYLLRCAAIQIAGRGSLLFSDADMGTDRLNIPAVLRVKDGLAVTSARLDQLLLGNDHASISAWLIAAPPFYGKSTLVHEWAGQRARTALLARHRFEPWGEVTVVLPMGSFDADGRLQMDQVPDRLIRFFGEQASGLPPLERLIDPQASEGIRLRLVFDGVDQLCIGKPDRAQALLTTLCQWLSAHARALLPSIFTVRQNDNVLSLQLDGQTNWRVREAALEGWGADEWKVYAQHTLSTDPKVADDLLGRLGADTADGKLIAEFCRVPGNFAAMCGLLRRSPDLVLPRFRAGLFLSLLWSAIRSAVQSPVLGGEVLFTDVLLPYHLRQSESLRQAAANGSALPEDRGLLLLGLEGLATVMFDASGADAFLAGTAQLKRALPSNVDVKTWRAAALRLGVCEELPGGRIRFAHDLWREFFAALALRPDGPWPDLSPPSLPVRQSAATFAAHQKGSTLHLPPKSGQHERVRFAAELHGDLERWINGLSGSNLPLAAQIATDHLVSLEPGLAEEAERHPLGQKLRMALLCRAQDAGMDLRLRLEAGLLLAALGDWQRFEYREVRLPAGGVRSGLCLLPDLWRNIGDSTGHWVGQIGKMDGFGAAFETPQVQLKLPSFIMSGYPVTRAEWRYFLCSDDYANPNADCWQRAGAGAQDWCKKNREALVRQRLRPEEASQGLTPVSGITAFQALAYVHWAAPLYNVDHPAGNGLQLCLPSELMWEAACGESMPNPFASFPSLQHLRAPSGWVGPAPIGVFAAGNTCTGMSDMFGNVQTWCASAATTVIRNQGWGNADARVAASTPIQSADHTASVCLWSVRGGHWASPGADFSAADRYFLRPDSAPLTVGLRLAFARIASS